MPKKIQKNKSLFGNIVIIIVILVLLIGTIILFIRSLNNTPKTFEDEAKEFCKESNVESVSICNGQVIEVKSSLLGGGSTYHHKDGTTFTCPVIAPTAMSSDCKAIFNADLAGEWNCIRVC